MELALIVVAVVLALTVASLAAVVRQDRVRQASGSQDALAPLSNGSSESSARDHLTVAEHSGHSELLLGDVPLMSLEPWIPAPEDQMTPVSSTFATWIGGMLDNPRVLDYIAGERWVLAKVPQAIKDGGKWMVSNGDAKAIALQPGSHEFAAIPKLARGGAAVGTGAALGPAIVGAAAVAYAHHQITSGLDRIEGHVKHLDRRMQAQDLGTISGSRRLLSEMEEWGPPHRWPEQLRWELAVRRAALDPVCFTQRATFERLSSAMSKEGKKFRGLQKEQRAALEHTLETLSLATMTRAQIGFATTMVLLDGTDAPFGLERLHRLTREFQRDMLGIVDDLQTALDGERPGAVGSFANRLLLIQRRKVGPTETLVTRLLAELAEVTAAIDVGTDITLALGVGDKGLEIATPIRVLSPEAEQADSVHDDDSDGGAPADPKASAY